MTRKRKSSFSDVCSSGGSDGEDDDELFLSSNSCDPDEIDESNGDGLFESNVSIYFIFWIVFVLYNHPFQFFFFSFF